MLWRSFFTRIWNTHFTTGSGTQESKLGLLLFNILWWNINIAGQATVGVRDRIQYKRNHEGVPQGSALGPILTMSVLKQVTNSADKSTNARVPLYTFSQSRINKMWKC
jgi:hypothetical protein